MLSRSLLLCAAMALFPECSSARENPAYLELKRIQDYCYGKKLSNAETGNCLADQEKRLRRELDAALRRKMFEIDEVEKRHPDDGFARGKEFADQWRAAFRKEQGSWAAYEEARCSNVANFEVAGGSGAGNYALTCSMRLILERMRHLTAEE